MSDGVLPDRELRAAVRDGWIASPVAHRRSAVPAGEPRPAAGARRLSAPRELPAVSRERAEPPRRARPRRERPRHRSAVADRLRRDACSAARCYLVPLLESLALPPDVRGRSNPKSTTGRLDIFTRVITDATPRFDEIRAGYRGALYLEVSPQSFPVRVQAGASLESAPAARRTDVACPTRRSRACIARRPLLYDDDERPIPPERVVVQRRPLHGRRSLRAG